MDRHDLTNSRFSKFCERALKTGYYIYHGCILLIRPVIFARDRESYLFKNETQILKILMWGMLRFFYAV